MVIKDYYELTKPRLSAVNLLVAGAAFVFGSGATIDWQALALMLAGLAGVVTSACVFNNYADRAIDARMERTKNRTLAAGRMEPAYAIIFGIALLLLGSILLLQTHPLALAAALVGFGVYVFVYTPLKSETPYALYAGAVAGAMPPVVGYSAAAEVLDYYALGLFFILFLWQIPHFLAIARYRFDEYKAAGVPLLVERPKNEEERASARKIFHYSLVFLVVLCLILIIQR